MKSHSELTPKKQKIIASAGIAVFLLLTVLVCILIGKPMVRYAAQPEQFRQWIDSYGSWGQLIYISMVFLQVLVAFIPGEPLEIVGGYAFGALEGTLLCLIASTVGSIVVFMLVRTFGMRLVEVFFSTEKLRSVRFLKSSPKRNYLFLLIFMIPGTPKDMLCYFAGLTDMRLPVWFLICSLGRIPSIVTSTIGGDALGTESYTFAIIVFAAALLISGLGILLYNRICTRHDS